MATRVVYFRWVAGDEEHDAGESGPDLPEAHQLQGWWDQGRDWQKFRPISLLTKTSTNKIAAPMQVVDWARQGRQLLDEIDTMRGSEA